jgi:predicted secreted protein with PEFG-CTERM motif
MKTKTIGSLIVLLAIVSIAVSVPSAYAAHANEAVVDMAPGSGTPGCEGTAEGCFLPTTVTIAAGGHVEWENTDNTMHVVASGNLTDDDAGALFNSQMMMAGATFSYTFADAGEYPYFCMVHPWMVGTVIAEDEGGHDDHGHEEEMEHTDMDMGGMEMQTLTAADITIDVADGAKAGEKVAIDVTINGEHVNYDIVATHNGETILDESDNHSHTGEGSHTTSALSADASDDNPIDVTVTFQGFGFPDADKTGPIGLTNTAQAVPEFGTIAAMILVVAIVSIIAITSKSRLSLTPKI